ncbi:acyltransferase [Nocardia panacis]|uniref:Acyltransferase n=1 Tax=Nocardia panacis TaxID=2340916 RepID=A0A3A4KEN0_9NOCA|nr:acyltransferase family protein [Nocardia panacis]RJO70919.1 acyltransferase [Nocardia panacis]
MSRASAPATTPVATTHHRGDLDGLRGIAIALVVVFHIWFGRVSGGVDIFLALSGYFFTGSLLRRAESTGRVGLRETAGRTARRLLPALVVVLAAVVVATIALRPYTQWPDIATQTLASLLYIQNWQLALSWSDYLAADPSVSPLQHLWSMSVQGQFYLAALLVIAGITAGCRRLGIAPRPAAAFVIATMAVASFVHAAQGMAAHQGWNYYDSTARAWELLAGALLATLAPYLTPPRALRPILAAAGLAIVFACGWLLDGASQFPGPLAVVPVAAALALILAAHHLGPTEQPPLLSRLLTSAPAVRLGELAYALYLWHWPLLIFYLAERDTPTAGFADGAILIAAALVLAQLTVRFVETPLRRPKRAPATTRRLVATLGVTLAVATVGTQVVLHLNPPKAAAALDPIRYPGAEALARGARIPDVPMRPSLFDAPADIPPPTGDGCIADWDTREVITCDYGDTTAERTIAVVGSSHAEHWVPALEVLARQHHFRIAVYLKMGCPLTVAQEPSYKGEANPDCRDWSREVLDRLAVDRPDWVFTTATRPRDGVGDETPQDYLQVWSELSDRDLKVLAVRDTPWLRRDEVRYRAIDCLAQHGNRLSCGMTRTDALDPVNPAAAPAAAYPNVFPLDLSDAVCDEQVCAASAGNVLIYHDEHHLTASYSRSLAPELGRQLGPILGWW